MTSTNTSMALLAGIPLLVGLIYYKSTEIKEPFMTSQFTPKRVSEISHQNNCFVSTSNNFESIVPPRISGQVSYGSSIRYDAPPMEHQALDPRNPLAASGLNEPTVRDSTTEGFCQDQTMQQSVVHSLNGDEIDNATQPIVYDRMIYANRKSRLRGDQDHIRGSLPITPNSGNWFNVSVTPHIDLNEGALSVMGGLTNELSAERKLLFDKSSAKTYSTLSGVDVNNTELVNTFDVYNQSSTGDINVSSFF